MSIITGNIAHGNYTKNSKTMDKEEIIKKINALNKELRTFGMSTFYCDGLNYVSEFIQDELIPHLQQRSESDAVEFGSFVQEYYRDTLDEAGITIIPASDLYKTYLEIKPKEK